MISNISNEHPGSKIMMPSKIPSPQASQEHSMIELEVAEMLSGLNGKETPL